MTAEKYLRRALQYGFAVRDGYRHLPQYKREAIDYIHSQPVPEEVLDRLKKIIVHAYLTTRYYKKTLDDAGFLPHEIRDFNDLKKLPFMTKDILQKEKESMVSDTFKGRLETSHTGGSSGNPTSFYRDRTCTAMRMGRQLGILEKCGYETGERCGLIWGAHADLNLSEGFGFKRKLRQFASGKKTLCCTVMDNQNMDAFHRELLSFKPDILYGYPNAMTAFAKHIRANRLEQICVKKIFCTAESLFPYQRSVLSGVFGGEVYNFYCTREHGCIGFECERHDGFHIDTGSVHVEIVSFGKSGSKEQGEIVVTDLLNYGMPFIRNRIGDMGVLSTEPCGCGCALPLLKSFGGRVTDQLLRTDGKTVSGLMLLDMIMDVPEVTWFQVVQQTLTDFDLFLVVDAGYNTAVEQKIIREMKGFFTENIRINIKIVSEIQRNPVSGKFQEVICNIKGKNIL